MFEYTMSVLSASQKLKFMQVDYLLGEKEWQVSERGKEKCKEMFFYSVHAPRKKYSDFIFIYLFQELQLPLNIVFILSRISATSCIPFTVFFWAICVQHNEDPSGQCPWGTSWWMHGSTIYPTCGFSPKYWEQLKSMVKCLGNFPLGNASDSSPACSSVCLAPWQTARFGCLHSLSQEFLHIPMVPSSPSPAAELRGWPSTVACCKHGGVRGPGYFVGPREESQDFYTTEDWVWPLQRCRALCDGVGCGGWIEREMLGVWNGDNLL